MKELIKWKESKNGKPLILKGARQVGKTYILKEFGNEYYDNVAYFNFEHNEGLMNLFLHTKEPARIIEQLALIHGKKIEEKKTLIIFDEIQECSNVLTSLKYFCYVGTPNYYTFDRSEIDFVIQYKNQIIPIEVKSNKGNNHLSLNKYKEKYHPNILVKVSTNNLIKDGNTINIPLFLIEYIEKLLVE